MIGNFVYESKNCYQCFDVALAEDCGYLADSGYIKDCYDVTLSSGQLSYELVQCEDQCYNCNFCVDANACRDRWRFSECKYTFLVTPGSKN